MNYKATYLFAACLLFLSTAISQQGNAQNSLGVIWEVPPNTTEANEQLGQFSELGVTHLEITHPVSSSTMELLERSELVILIRSEERFFTVSEIEAQSDQLIENYVEFAEQYRPYLNVAALGLLSHSHFEHPLFSDVFKPIIDSLSAVSNKSFYVFHREKWYNIGNPQQPFGIFYPDQSYQPSDLFEFDSAMRSLIATNSDQLLFIRSSWLLEAVSQYPELSNSLIEYQEKNLWELPFPNARDYGASSNWIVLILLILWSALAVQVKYLPYVRPLIMRFYLAHRFYVDDILHYRERYLAPGILMMIKHAIFGGLVFYIVAQILFSDHGIEAFFHHLPFFAITGSNYFSFFFFGLILILLTQIVALLWLYLPAKSLGHFSQAINLYAGSFYVDFFIITLMVTLFTAEIGTSITLMLAVIYVLIWFFAFNLAAFDASRNMGSGRIFYLLLTIGLHTILSFAALLLILLNTDIIEILDLAISL